MEKYCWWLVRDTSPRGTKRSTLFISVSPSMWHEAMPTISIWELLSGTNISRWIPEWPKAHAWAYEIRSISKSHEILPLSLIKRLYVRKQDSEVKSKYNLSGKRNPYVDQWRDTCYERLLLCRLLYSGSWGLSLPLCHPWIECAWLFILISENRFLYQLSERDLRFV